MFYIFLLFASYSIFASTADVIAQPYIEDKQCPNQFAKLDLQNPEKTATPPGVTISENGEYAYISTTGRSIAQIRAAAFAFHNSPIPERWTPSRYWPFFDYLLENVFLSCAHHHPVGLLQLIFHSSKCIPLNSQAIWEDNQKHLSVFQVIEQRLEYEQDSKTRKLLSQLHSVGTLALAGLSETMHSELSNLFDTIYSELKLVDEEITHTAIAMPKKAVFIHARHQEYQGLLPWQSIGAFSHYTRWLIEYRKTLSPGNDAHTAELYKIVTKQINAFLSPQWTSVDDTIFPSLPHHSDWNTVLWISDEYVKEFLTFAATQSCDECKFTQIVAAYEKASIELLNAKECVSQLHRYLHNLEWIILSNNTTMDEEPKEILEKAKPMLTVNIPTGDGQTTPYLLRDPYKAYRQLLIRESHAMSVLKLHEPKASKFVPGSDHLRHAQKWHQYFVTIFTKAGGEGFIEFDLCNQEGDLEPANSTDSQCIIL